MRTNGKKIMQKQQKMVETAERTHRVLNIAYQNRYRTDSLYLKEMCKSDELGEIYFAKAHALRRRAVPTWGVFLKWKKNRAAVL